MGWTPSHRIVGVREAHPQSWHHAEVTQRARIQYLWETFLHTNPHHRPGHPPDRRQRVENGTYCLIEQASKLSSKRCRTPGCPGCLRRSGPSGISLVDHTEQWYVQIDDLPFPAAVMHPYMHTVSACAEAESLLHAIGPVHGPKAALYVSANDHDWYNPPHAVTVFIQPASAPAIRGWVPVRIAHPKPRLTLVKR